MLKPPPAGWPRLSPGLYYRDPAAAIDWLCAAFGFEVRLKVEGEGGSIVHSELSYGDALVMVGGDHTPADDPKYAFKRVQTSPARIDGRNTIGLLMYVDDVDAHCARARAHGAVIFDEPSTHDYGDDYWCDRSYGAWDCEGHGWWFSQRLRDEPAR